MSEIKIFDLGPGGIEWEGTEAWFRQVTVEPPRITAGSNLHEFTHAARVGMEQNVRVENTEGKPPFGGYHRGERAENMNA